MRQFASIILLFLCINGAYTQNIISPVWQIAVDDSLFVGQHKTVYTNWPDVNLLLSWERQGFSWINEQVCLTNTFNVNKKDTDLVASIALQCDVQGIFINDIKIGGDIRNTFWSERGKKTRIEIPDSILIDGENRITLTLSNLSYTGGISHNILMITPRVNNQNSDVNLSFSSENHVFEGVKDINLTIVTESKRGGNLKLVVNNDFHKLVVNDTLEISKGVNQVEFDLTQYNLEPGFYECIAIFEDGAYSGDVQWFAVQPELIGCNTSIPDGFDIYWQNALTELKSIEPKYKIQKVDSLCSKTRDGYVINMQSLGDLTIRGYYFVPKSDGEHPVVLHVPGYSYGFEHLDGFINREGVMAELALCVRGHGISADVFNPWAEQTLWSVNICDEQKQIYRSIYMDCVRAVEFLKSRPEIDEGKIGVAGGSQGGGLAIATAGLMPNDISACAFFDPFLSDIREHTEIREIINGEFKVFLSHKDNNCSMEQLFNNQDLIDVRGFADKILCPVYFEAALFDDDCPVHIGFAGYNRINSRKKYRVFPNDSHLGESGEYGNLFYFIEGQFTRK